MTNTSASGGYLAPTGATPLNDDALTEFLGDVVAAITGINRDAAVLPRWQSNDPNLPTAGTDWVSIGVTTQTGDTFAYIGHDPTGAGADSVQRRELLDLMCSFYGPHSDAMASLLRDGLSVPQNREVLFLAGFGVVEVGALTAAPTLIKNLWTGKTDITATLARQVIRTFPVLNLLTAPGSVQAPPNTAPFNAH